MVVVVSHCVPLSPFRVFWLVRPPSPSCTVQLDLSAIRVAGSRRFFRGGVNIRP